MRLVGAILFILAVWASPANAKQRAFIVGVADYAHLPDLQKTLGDAAGYRSVFADDLHFETIVLQDPDTLTFLNAFEKFRGEIEPGDEVVFVFSGHGWSDGVENYLVLSDAPAFSTEYQLRKQTVSLTSDILNEINARSPGLFLAIIDACRDNPVDTGTRSVARGLVRQDIVRGTMVVYSAGARETALDRLGDDDPSPYSIFARSLLPRLRDKALPLMIAVDQARDEVQSLAASIRHDQRPAVYSDVSLNFCFALDCRTSASGSSPSAIDLYFKTLASPCDYLEFAETYPSHALAPLARARAKDCRNLSDPASTAASSDSTAPSSDRDIALNELAALLGNKTRAASQTFPALGLARRAGVVFQSKDRHQPNALLILGEAVTAVGYSDDGTAFSVKHTRYGDGLILIGDLAIQ